VPDLPDLEVELAFDLSGFQQAMDDAGRTMRALTDSLGPMFEGAAQAVGRVSAWYMGLEPEQREQLSALLITPELSELGTGMEK
jgi:hypothetical protein